MKYRVVHTTAYRYGEPVNLGHSEAHLRPRVLARQTCWESRIDVLPAPSVTAERADYFGNSVLYFAQQEPHDSLTVVASSTVTVEPQALPPELSSSTPWEQVPARLLADPSPAAADARELALESLLVPTDAQLAAYAAPSFAPGRPLLEATFDLTRRIYRDFSYDPDLTTVATPVLEVLQQRSGVCQDFTHLALGCLRSLGLSARYVSGYIESLPAVGHHAVRGADASHAWFSVYDPGHGWVDFDPTNDQIVGEQHVTLAWGRDYPDVTPLKGVVFGGGTHMLEVAVAMTRLAE